MNSSQHTNNLDNSKNVLEDKTINKANDLILLDEIRKIKNALNEEIARIVKKSSDLVYNPGDNKKLDEKRAKVNFLEAVYNGYVLGAQIISSSGNHDNNNYSDIISPHLGPARSLADCVKLNLSIHLLSRNLRYQIFNISNLLMLRALQSCGNRCEQPFYQYFRTNLAYLKHQKNISPN